jgi:hypothetical protein
MRKHLSIRAATVLSLAAALVLTAGGVAHANVSRAWTHQFGRDGTDIAHGVAVDSERNVYVAGRIQTLRGDDCFLRRYGPNGARRWKRVFGTDSGDYCLDVAVARNGSVYVVGYTYGALQGTRAGSQDAFVRKYRRDGSVVWTRQFGTGSGEQAQAVAVDGAGNVIVAGYTGGRLGGRPSQGEWDAFLRKYRPNGRHVWTRQFGSAQTDFAYGVAVDASRNIVIAGQTFGSIGGAPARGGSDAFVRKYRPNGERLWTRTVGTAADDAGADVAIDGRGRVYLVGLTEGALPGQTAHGSSDGFVRKYRPNGSRIWTRQFGTPGPDSASAAVVDRAGRLYLAGGIYVGLNDGFVMKMRPDGAMAWLRKVGSGASIEEARDVAVDRKRHVLVVGLTGGSIGGQPWSGGWDAWVRKYRP